MKAREEDVELFTQVLDEYGLVEVERVRRCSAPCVSRVVDEHDVVWWLKVHESEWATDAEYDALTGFAPVCAGVQRVADRALLVEDLSEGELCDVAFAPHRVALARALARIHEATPSSRARPLDAHVAEAHARLLADPDLNEEHEAFASAALDRLVDVEPVLLHGDPNRRNMRVIDGEVRLFDPYGIAGDPAYDVAFAATMGWTEDRDTLVEQLVASYGSSLANVDAWMDWLAVSRLAVLRRMQRPCEAHERHLSRRLHRSAPVPS